MRDMIRERNLVIAYVVVVTGMIAVALSRPVIALVINSRIGSMFSVTLLTTCYMVPRALFSPVVGYFHDRGVSPRIIAGIGFGGFFAALMGYITFPPSTIIYLLKVVEGISGAAAWPGLQMVVLDESKGHKEMGTYFALGNAGAIAGYAMLSITGNDFWVALFASAIFEALSFLLVLFLEQKNRDLPVKRKNLQNNWKGGDPSLAIRGSIIVVAISGFLKGLYLDFISVYAANVLALGISGMSFFLVGTRIIGSLSAYFGPRGIDSRPVKTLNLTAIAILIGSTLILFLNYLAIIGFFILIATVSLAAPITRSHLKYSGTKTGTKVGWINSLSNITSALAPLYGFFYDAFGYHIETPLGPLIVPMIIVFALGVSESIAIYCYLTKYHKKRRMKINS